MSRNAGDNRMRRCAGPRPGEGHGAFSLVELVVVIGILMVLVSLMVPALGRTKEQARLTRLLGTAQQLGLLIDAYANETRDAYPRSEYDTTGRCADSWAEPLTKRGMLDEDIARVSGDFWLSIAMLYNRQLMRHEGLPPGNVFDQPPIQVYRQEVAFPSAKGLLCMMDTRDDLPTGLSGEDAARYVWCCTPLSPEGPVTFADGSAVVGRWTEFLRGNDLEVVNGVGFPVITTWDGVAGRDR